MNTQFLRDQQIHRFVVIDYILPELINIFYDTKLFRLSIDKKFEKHFLDCLYIFIGHFNRAKQIMGSQQNVGLLIS